MITLQFDEINSLLGNDIGHKRRMCTYPSEFFSFKRHINIYMGHSIYSAPPSSPVEGSLDFTPAEKLFLLLPREEDCSYTVSFQSLLEDQRCLLKGHGCPFRNDL